MNSSTFQLGAIDRAYARFSSMSAIRIIVGHLTEKFWAVTFFTIACSCCFAAFSLTPFAGEAKSSVFIHVLTALVYGISFMMCAHIIGATSHLEDRSILKLTVKVIFCSLVSAVVVTLIMSVILFQPVGRYILLIGSITSVCIAILVRTAAWAFTSTYHPVITLIGDEKFCDEKSQYLKSQPLPLRLETLSLADNIAKPVFVPNFNTTSYPVSQSRLTQWFRDSQADHIVYQPDHWEVLEEPMVAALSAGKMVSPFSEYVEERYQTMPTTEIPNSALFSKSFANSSPSYLLGKRLCDLMLSMIGMILSLPIIAITAVLIKLEDRGPVFYKQTRVGRYGELFSIYKIRSMCIDSEKGGAKWASKGDSRITRVGKILRRTRIDELPQFFNIFKGDMSFIGPRPERPEFTASLEEELRHYRLRHLLKPGLTGWAQINYPYGDSIEDAHQKLTYDLYYVKYATLVLDFQITLRTVGAAMQGAR
ncbi:MAG: exopolysaccharide biosynthesis polyprenyl glycosylphosphotransferase [Akkermansiaceae bacterium]